MRILMFGWEFPPRCTGGLGTHCYGLTKALSEENVDVTFVMPKAGGGTRHGFLRMINAGEGSDLIEIESCLEPYVASVDTVHVHPGDVKGVKDLYGMNLFREVERYARLASASVKGVECDVIHCHDWMTFPAGIRAKKMKGKPLVVTIHSTEHDRNPVSPDQRIAEIEWKGMYEADRIITVSRYMKARIMEKYGVPGNKVSVIYNAVDPGEYTGERVSFGLDEKVVLFLGRLTMQKGPDYFLRAARKVLDMENDVRFVVVGTGNMMPQLINQAIDLGISDRVIFTGYSKSIREYYKMADVYVMPSVSEPFGIVALEAVASGLPVLISRQSGVSEVLRNCMKVDFWDVDDMASKMLGMLRYGELRDEMASNGTREVWCMSWKSVAQKTISAYSSTLGG